MHKRFVANVLRQLGLLCLNNQSKYLLTRASDGKLTIPVINIDNTSTFQAALAEQYRRRGVEIDVKGVVEFEAGNNGNNNFYRCSYLVQLKGTQPLILNKNQVFAGTNELKEGMINEQSLQTLRKLKENKYVYNTQLFRQNFKELAKRDSNIRLLIDI